MGDISDDDDEEKMKECLRLAGADKIVAKFPKGLDGRLGPYPAAATPQSLLKDFVEEDLEVCLDTETTATFKPFEEESFGHTALPTRFANIDCDFSPGEWSKMCFARSLMRQTADLRYVSFYWLVAPCQSTC